MTRHKYRQLSDREKNVLITEKVLGFGTRIMQNGKAYHTGKKKFKENSRTAQTISGTLTVDDLQLIDPFVQSIDAAWVLVERSGFICSIKYEKYENCLGDCRVTLWDRTMPAGDYKGWSLGLPSLSQALCEAVLVSVGVIPFTSQ